MPNLARMVENGVMGDLATLTPLCSPLLWTSVATGTFADRHQVLDTVESDPVTGGVRPVTRASLGSTQIWDILAQEGLRCQAIGWPATHPAEAPGTCVSNGFAHSLPNSIYPPELESTILPLRFNPQEWTGKELQLFVPEMARIDQDKDKRLAKLAVILAEATSVLAAATTLLESKDWDFSAVWFGAVGWASEVFPSGTDEIYKEVVNGVYRLLDLYLGRLLDLAGPEAIVMLVSDRTAGESEWRPSTSRGPGGLLCAAGPGIDSDELTFGAGLLDIAPTILGLFGFGRAPGMTGRAISEICATAYGRALQNVLPTRSASRVAHDSLEQEMLALEEFGYTDTVAAAWKDEADAAKTRRDFHLARVLLAQGRLDEAISLFEHLVERNPALVEMRLYLGHAYFQSSRLAECRAICEPLIVDAPDSPFASAARAHLDIAEGNYDEALAHLASGQKVYGIVAALDAVVGEAYLRMGKLDEAVTAFRSAIETDAGIAGAHQGLAQAYLAQGLYNEAAEAALDAIRLRYDLPGAHNILGRALKAMGREQAAAGAFANSEELSRRLPVA